MEIELLKRKLNYYSNQLTHERIAAMSYDDRQNMLVVIRSIQKELSCKIIDLEAKTSKSQLGYFDTCPEKSLLTSDLKALPQGKRTKPVAEFDSNLAFDINADDYDESRLSVSTIKTTVSIPNEYD